MIRSWTTKVQPVQEEMTGYQFDQWLKRRGMNSGVDFLLLPVAGSGFAGKIVGLAALGKDADLQPFFSAFNMEIDWNSVEHPPLRDLPFDMQAAARKLNIPRDKFIVPQDLPVQQVIDSLLRDIGRSR